MVSGLLSINSLVLEVWWIFEGIGKYLVVVASFPNGGFILAAVGMV